MRRAFLRQRAVIALKDEEKEVAPAGRGSPELGASNFGLTSYLDESNRQSRCIDMDRGGFTLLAMGVPDEG